ncbi:hypothetical protein SAMN04488542_13317 [Fontibacillus panacisegetis]|uniref:Uncharacterized protein n=1 Tax=Fontibacillus panacisegetis TaxID=670482 RepID=A0A1G7SZ83_9BACL|nr:hypothetical protein [Fontibacillus panacisegetis]SDG28377.1 hypothetical protein SAMN04488542_13317 [Fontibacillus panacisegetis]
MQLILFLLTSIALLSIAFVIISHEIDRIIMVINVLFVSYLSYIALCSLILDLINIRTTGVTISIINVLVIIFLITLYRKRKIDLKISKLKFTTHDIYVCILSLAFSIFVFFHMYTSSMNINFLTTDPSVHYLFSKYFSHTGRLLLSINDMISYMHMSSYPFLSYVNTGLLMSFSTSNSLNLGIYLTSNFIFYFFTIITIYNMYISITKKTDYLQITILSIATAIGYNMNSILFGFTSQMAGILLALAFIFIADRIEKGTLRIVLLTLNLVGLMFAYYYFIPPAIMGFVLTNLLKDGYKKPDLNIQTVIKRMSTLENLIVCGFTFLFGCVYLVFLNHTVEAGGVGSISAEGFIYRELYSDFKPYLLFSGVALFYLLREKQKSLILASSITYFSYAIVIFIFGMLGIASSYYFYKNYYLLENIFILLFAIGLNYTKEKFKPLFICYIGVICFLGLASIAFDEPIQKKNNLFNIEIERNITKVQKFNKDVSKNMSIIYTNEQREFMDYILANKDEYVGENSYLPVIGDLLQQLWFYSYTEIWPKYNNTALAAMYEPNILDYNAWKSDPNKNSYIVLIHGTSDNWVKEQNVDLSLFDTVYKTEGATLYKYRTVK